MQWLALFFLSSALGAFASPAQPRQEKVSYDGVGVYRVPIGSDASQVAELVEKLDLETWKSYRKPGSYADVVVPPEKLKTFQAEVAGIEGVEVMFEDLGPAIAAEQEPAFQTMRVDENAVAAINTTWFSAYHAYADHLSFLNGLVSKNPANAEIVTSGTSLQGNVITGIHIFGSAGKGVKPAVVFHGTVHAREWITTMVSLKVKNHFD